MIPLSKAFRDRASRNLNFADFLSGARPEPVGNCRAEPFVDEQHILRMMVRRPGSDFQIPPELEWLRSTIWELDAAQRAQGLNNQFVYVTVRHGAVRSETDDLWHVDGFSMRVPHLPEQNYVCASRTPTEFLVKHWGIPKDFDPMRHNIHRYFQQNDDGGWRMCGEPFVIYAIDPYCVHRRPTVLDGTKRTFWRVSFIQIEIEDDTCTQNQLLPTKRYGRDDVRVRLIDYPAPEAE